MRTWPSSLRSCSRSPCCSYTSIIRDPRLRPPGSAQAVESEGAPSIRLRFLRPLSGHQAKQIETPKRLPLRRSRGARTVSLEAQTQAIERYAAAQGWPIVEMLADDGVSGGKRSRLGLIADRLRATGAQRVICYTASTASPVTSRPRWTRSRPIRSAVWNSISPGGGGLRPNRAPDSSPSASRPCSRSSTASSVRKRSPARWRH